MYSKDFLYIEIFNRKMNSNRNFSESQLSLVMSYVVQRIVVD